MWLNRTSISQLIYNKSFTTLVSFPLKWPLLPLFFFFYFFLEAVDHFLLKESIPHSWQSMFVSTFLLSHHFFAADLMHKSCNKQLLPVIHSGTTLPISQVFEGIFLPFFFFPKCFLCSQMSRIQISNWTQTDPKTWFHLSCPASGDEPKHPSAKRSILWHYLWLIPVPQATLMQELYVICCESL